MFCLDNSFYISFILNGQELKSTAEDISGTTPSIFFECNISSFKGFPCCVNNLDTKKREGSYSLN